MVNPGKRMHVLKALLDLRLGPGAAILPPEITRIHLDFALRWNEGHMGPRKFWRSCMPRLKYWNPAVPMLVNRTTNNTGPATMSLYFRQSGTKIPFKNQIPIAQQPHSSTTNEHPAPPPEEGEKVVHIEMKNQHSDAILAEFLEKTGATLITPTPDEEMEMRQVEELRERGDFDREIVRKFIFEKRKNESMLDKARKEAEAIRMANQ